uniref:Uncharacterized protein n=1 Tax=Hucho hucho TaxID=62062 RepID=A0A4W5LVN3_9TELE
MFFVFNPHTHTCCCYVFSLSLSVCVCVCVLGDEVGMLEDMEMGVSDLNRVSFRITEAKSEQPTDLLPSVTGLRGCFCVEVPLPSETYLLLPGELRDGRDLRVHPLLFNIGINQQQSLAER